MEGGHSQNACLIKNMSRIGRDLSKFYNLNKFNPI